MTAPARAARSPVWTHAAAFGALWGAAEVTLGSFLHAVKIPCAGLFLTAFAAALLSAERSFCARRGVSIATALVAALLKGFSPAGAILGPMLAILVEGLLLELAFLPWPRSRTGAFLGGFLAVTWSLAQSYVTQALLYGGDILQLYVRIVTKAAEWVGIDPHHGWLALSAIALAFATTGGLVTFWGAGVGRRVAAAPAPAWQEAA